MVFTNPEVTQILGRVSETEMRAEREIVRKSALQIIRNNPTALVLPDKKDGWLSGLTIAEVVIDFLNQYRLCLATIVVCLVGLLFWRAWLRSLQ